MLPKVISSTEGRVVSCTHDGLPAVRKLTNRAELEGLIEARGQISGQQLQAGTSSYTLSVPQAYEWNEADGNLVLEYCPGENLELMLRDQGKRPRAVEILNAMLRYCLDEPFYWHDFAPRNILVDGDKLHILDFERGIKPDGVNDHQGFLEGKIYREYAAFLLPTERLVSTDVIFSEQEDCTPVRVATIDSKWIKRILARTHGVRDEICRGDILAATRTLVDAEEPYQKQDGTVEFPIIELEGLKKIDDGRTYIEAVIGRVRPRYAPKSCATHDFN